MDLEGASGLEVQSNGFQEKPKQEEAATVEKSVTRQVALGLLTNFSSIAPSMSLGFSAVVIPILTSSSQTEPFTNNQASWFASIASLATPFGCLFSGPIADKYGRRLAIFCVNIICFIGWLVIASAYYVENSEQKYAILLLGRFLTGLSTGLSSIPATIYMAEISSPKLRGVFCTWASVSFSIGVLIIYVLGYIFKDYWGTMALVTACFPCVGVLFLIYFVPESPVWLIAKNRFHEAQNNLCKIYGVKECIPEVQNEIDLLISTRGIKSIPRKKSIYEQFKRKFEYLMKPNCLRPFLLVIIFFFFQQFSGTFVIVFYAIDIVKEAGVTLDPYLAIVIIGIVRLLAAMLVSYICKIFGRRPLSIVSGSGMTLCMILLAIYTLVVKQGKINEPQEYNWVPVVLLLAYFFTSTLGFLPLPFAMSAEVFPRKIRGTASGLGSFFAYFFNFITVKIYPDMVSSLDNYGVFWFYGAVSLAGTFFVAFFLPETKGKTLEEIEQYFVKKPAKRNSLLKNSPLN